MPAVQPEEVPAGAPGADALDDLRPVDGTRLNDLVWELQLRASDASWLFGVSPITWADVNHETARSDLLPDSAMSLLVRFIERDPSRLILPRRIGVADFYAYLNELYAKRHRDVQDGLTDKPSLGPKLPKKRFSLALGRESSSGYRWIEKLADATPLVDHIVITPLVDHIVITLCRAMLEKDRDGGDLLEVWEEWLGHCDAEAATRGCDHIWTAHNWPKARRTERRRQATLGTYVNRAIKAGASPENAVEEAIRMARADGIDLEAGAA